MNAPTIFCLKSKNNGRLIFKVCRLLFCYNYKSKYKIVIFKVGRGMNKHEIYNFLNDKNIWHEITEHKAVFHMAELS